MKLVVIGNKQGDDPRIMEIARELGRLAAKNDITIVTGGGRGLPLEVARACKEAGGKTIGISPAIHLAEHLDHSWEIKCFTDLMCIGSKFPKDISVFRNPGFDFNCPDVNDFEPWDLRLKYLNTDLMATGDAVCVVSGDWGTLTEFGINATIGKPVYIITETGGYADCIDYLTKRLGPSKSYLYYCKSARQAIDWVLAY